MIIDAHSHVWAWDMVSDNYWNALADYIVSVFKRNKLGAITRDQVKTSILDPMMDPDGAKLISNMDQAGVDKSFILALDWGYGIGEAEKTIDDINQFYGSLAKKYPDRIVAFAGVDPRREDAVAILERAVNDYGCRGLKYHPASGFYPDSEASYKVLEKAQAYGIPLLSHLGPISRPLKSKYARPVYLDTIVADFPDMTVIGAHMGFCWHHELVNLISAKSTTFYADFSGQQILARKNFTGLCQMLRSAFDEAGAEKFLWGTDSPALEGVLTMKDWMKMIQDLPENAPAGMVFTREEIDAVLGENAADIISR